MQEFFLLENTLAHVLEMQNDKTKKEKEIKSSKKKIRKERRNGKNLSDEFMVLNKRYTESAMTKKISTTGKKITELKKSKSQIENKLEKNVNTNAKIAVWSGVFLVIFAILGAIDLHLDLQDMPFVCSNDELVLASDVQNEVDDCTDGSDESTTFWGNSRADDYVMDVKDGTWFTVIFACVLFLPGSWIAIYSSTNNRTLFTLMIILVSSSSVGLYSTIDLNQTWECDDGEEIHWSSVLDGKQNCADGSDERRSGWTGDTTRAENAYSASSPLGEYAFSYWGLGILFVISCFLGNFLFPNSIENLETDKEKINQTISSKKNAQNRLKTDLKRMKKLPRLIELSNESVTVLEVKIANADARVLSLNLSISDEMDKISHLIPYSNS